MKNTILLFFSFFFAIGMAYGQVTYNVSGVAQLEDEMIPDGDHSDVKIVFFNLPSMVREDSTYTDSEGNYSINISPGYYLVEWTRDGYVPWELGGLSLASNIILEPLFLLPGEVNIVGGTINTTTWTTNYVYYVEEDLVIPSGQTLTINEGVRVKFYEGKGMTVNGKLLVNGTEDQQVIFTSKEPTPNPGDWANLELNGRDNHISYLKYDYASNGITGENVDHTTIDHLMIQGTLALDSDGINFNSGDSLTITNNILVASKDGIRSMNAAHSSFSNNVISVAGKGLDIDNCDYCHVSDNKISFGESGFVSQGIFREDCS